jgi:hypothetical protein
VIGNYLVEDSGAFCRSRNFALQAVAEPCVVRSGENAHCGKRRLWCLRCGRFFRFQRLFLHGQIGFERHVGGCAACVTEPERHRGDSHPRLEHMPGGRVANHQRRDGCVSQVGTRGDGSQDRVLSQGGDSITRQGLAPGIGKGTLPACSPSSRNQVFNR